jgi:hypothetical protein
LRRAELCRADCALRSDSDARVPVFQALFNLSGIQTRVAFFSAVAGVFSIE